LFSKREQLSAQFPRLELLLPATVVKIPLAVLQVLFAQELILAWIAAQKLLKPFFQAAFEVVKPGGTHGI
jgi:hypothetical protein